jgi:NAD(P)-dependent dehydrogenase (short-subunit alcohol dehydrogenase family)
VGTYLITGIGRGIGQELARVLLHRGDRVIGTLRGLNQAPPAWSEYTTTGQLMLLGLDVRIVEAFLPHLKRAKAAKIVTLSSRMGSLSYAKSDRIAYRASKAAVNKVVQGLATDLQAEGIVAISVHPGWVRTDMGGSGADIPAQQSAAGLVALIDRLTLDDTGGFFDWQGERLSF